MVLFAFACIIKHLQSGLWWFLEQRKMPRVKKRRKKRKGSERRGCPKNRQFIWERESEARSFNLYVFKRKKHFQPNYTGFKKMNNLWIVKKKKQCRETGSAKGLFYCDWLFLCKATDDSGHLKRSCSSLMGQLWTCCLLFSRLGISKSQSRGPRTNTGAPFAYARGNVKRLAQLEKKEEEQKNGNFQWTFSRKVN